MAFATLYNEFSVILGVGVSCGTGTLLGVDSSGKGVLATITSGTFVAARGFAITSGTAGDRITCYRSGKSKGYVGLTKGGTVYSAGSGQITQTAPTTPGQLVQAVGFAPDATTVIWSITEQRTIAQVGV
jgi:hypothetical protein